MITTLVGAFFAPFIITIAWGKLVEKFGPAGGWLAAGFLVGTLWAICHSNGVGIPGTQNYNPGIHNLIVQGENSPWVDMAWAIGAGILANTALHGNKIGKAIPTLLATSLGGVLAGFVLSVVGK